MDRYTINEMQRTGAGDRAAYADGLDEISSLMERVERLEAWRAEQENQWESVSQLQQRFHIGFAKAKALCQVTGVRQRAFGNRTRYCVADCERAVDAGAVGKLRAYAIPRRAQNRKEK